MSNFYHEGKMMLKVCKAKTHKIINSNGVTTRCIEDTNVGSRNKSLKRMFLRQVIVILLLKSRNALACLGYGYYGYGDGVNDTNHQWDFDDSDDEERGPSVSHLKDPVERNKHSFWGAWTPPPEVEKHWRDWLHEYQLKNNQTDFATDENRERLQKEREQLHYWPPGWKDLGEGHEGADPPPWAYVNKYTGKPDACFRKPRVGSCNQKLTKWGWNVMLNKCLAYTYSGCEGSLNLFDTKALCEEKCSADPPPSCDSDSGIPIGHV